MIRRRAGEADVFARNDADERRRARNLGRGRAVVDFVDPGQTADAERLRRDVGDGVGRRLSARQLREVDRPRSEKISSSTTRRLDRAEKPAASPDRMHLDAIVAKLGSRLR